MPNTLTFHDQSQHCGNCDEDITTDTVFDLDTTRTYFFCPLCGQGNATDHDEEDS